MILTGRLFGVGCKGDGQSPGLIYMWGCVCEEKEEEGKERKEGKKWGWGRERWKSEGLTSSVSIRCSVCVKSSSGISLRVVFFKRGEVPPRLDP